jgi:L-amino acid N-acyltransferase YncA
VTEIRVATETDLEGILNLQAANQPERGGRLSACLPRSRIVSMMCEMPLFVALRNDRVVGYLMTSSRAMNADIPIIRAMLDAYSCSEEAYVYGPICVEEGERGKGLALGLFEELRRQLPDREGILFIRRDNAASIHAHSKMGMREAAQFEFGGTDHVVFSYLG